MGEVQAPKDSSGATVAPSIDSVLPTNGPIAGGTTLSLSGNAFATGMSVAIGGVPCASVSVSSNSSATCVTGANSAGAKSITVQTQVKDKTLTGTKINAFTYIGPPAVTSTSPSTGTIAGGTTVTINGSGFQSGATVEFVLNDNGTPNDVSDDTTSSCNFATYFNSARIDCQTAAVAAGSYPVRVTNPDNQFNSTGASFDFAVLPNPTSVNINAMQISGGIPITISGTDFSNTVSVTVAGIPCASPVVTQGTPDTIVCTPGNAGTARSGDIVVVNDSNPILTGTYSNSFTFQGPPTITNVSPTGANPAANELITITGTGFDTTNGFTVELNGVQCDVLAGFTATSFQCTTRITVAGTGDVVIRNNDNGQTPTDPPSVVGPGQTVTQTNGFTYVAPPVLSAVDVANANVTPAGAIAGGTSITLTGTGFNASATVSVGGDTCAITSTTPPTTIVCDTPAGTAGLADITVTNPTGQSSTLTNAFRYQVAPDVTGITPNGGNVSGVATVTISGTGFDTSNSVSVTVGGAACDSLSSITATSIDCDLPTGTIGQVDVVVTNLDGDLQSDTLTNGFTYQAPPSVGGVTANVGPLAGGNTVTVSGANFLSGLSATIGGNPCTNVNFQSITSFTCQVPSGSAGTVGITVTNPDGQSATGASLYTYQAAPTISSISPNAGRTIGSFSTTILGTGFQTGVSVSINGSPCSPVNIVNSGEINCTVPGNVPGSYDVIVTNTDGQAAIENNGFTFQSPPSVASVSPAIIADNGSTNITISGTGFDASNGINDVLIGSSSCPIVSFNTTSITCTPAAQAAGVYDITVINDDGGTQQNTLGSALTLLDAPTLSTVSPTGGPVSGGTLITLTGTNFFAGATVNINGSVCVGPVVNSPTEIECTTPVGVLGSQPVTVTNVDGQSVTLPTSFTYAAPPSLSSVVPANGDLDGGTSIVLNGADFVTGATVSIGGVACNVTGDTATTINCDTGANTAGFKDVVVTNPDGQTDTLTLAFLHKGPPTISSVSPGLGSSNGGDTVTITGTNFDTTNGIQSVTLNGAACAVSPNPPTSSTEITCTSGAGTGGLGDVVVTNNDADSQSATLSNGWIYIDPPTVASVNVSNGPASGGTTVRITGTGFQSGGGLSASIGSYPCASTTYVDANNVDCVTGVGVAGPFQVSVTNFDGQTGTSAGNLFTYDPPPDAVSTNRTYSRLSGGTSISITGSSFVTTPTVSIEGDACVVTLDSATSITCTLPAKAAGTYDITVTNPDGQTDTLTDEITYIPAPTVGGAAPSIIGTAGGGIIISGSDFVGTVSVTVNGTACASPVVGGGGTTISCTAPALAAGSYTVAMTNGDDDNQTGSLASAITYVASPTISGGGISPANGPITGSTPITITGTNFTNAPLPVVSVGGSLCTGVTVTGTTQIDCTTPSGTAGAQDVVITQYGSISVTETGGFTYDPPPTVDSVSPVVGPASGSTAITITGTGFQNAPTSITVGGVACTGIGFNSATEVTCTTGGSGPTGSASDIIVTNLDGQVGSGSGLFTYLDPPDITSIAPTSAAAGVSQTITLTGLNFNAPTSITVGGLACTSISLVDATTVSCDTSAALTGTAAYDVVITNSDGQTDTLGSAFTVEAVPSIGGVSPSSGTVDGGTTVTIVGSDFEAGATVYFGAQGVTPTTVTATTITVTSPANGATGAVDIRVENPTGQDDTSSGAFTYTPAAPELEWQVGGANPDNPALFPSTGVNTSLTFVLKNVGSVPSSAITISITGANSGAFFLPSPGSGDDCSTNTLASGATCEVDVIFLGSFFAGGPYNAILNATDGTTSDTNALQGGP